MSDTSDNVIIHNSISDPVFQHRVRLRFINSAIAVTTEAGTVTNHTQRLAFAGALFANTVDVIILCMIILANTTNRTNCLAAPNSAGGNILDSDIDFQVNSVFTGMSISRTW